MTNIIKQTVFLTFQNSLREKIVKSSCYKEHFRDNHCQELKTKKEYVNFIDHIEYVDGGCV